jgi:hypothetical protein
MPWAWRFEKRFAPFGCVSLFRQKFLEKGVWGKEPFPTVFHAQRKPFCGIGLRENVVSHCPYNALHRPCLGHGVLKKGSPHLGVSHYFDKSFWKRGCGGKNLFRLYFMRKGSPFAGSGCAKTWFRTALTVLCTGHALGMAF